MKFNTSTYAVTACLIMISVTVSAQEMPGKGMVTQWAKDVSSTHPLPEYPRPMLERPRWLSLNGQWDQAVTDDTVTTAPKTFDGKIVVPYPYESTLSGIRQNLPEHKILWYHRLFITPAEWSRDKILLNFGAVNWHATVYLNGQEIFQHRGGYDGFAVDLTATIKPAENELVVGVENPLIVAATDAQVLGKQRRKPGGIYYTACTGIWQTVWLEPVPAAHITSLKLVPDIDAKVLHATVTTDGSSVPVDVSVKDGTTLATSKSGETGADISLPIASPHLWSPNDPHLYTIHFSLGSGDSVDSYFAMRKISLGRDSAGHTRIFLNNSFLFEVGALDQGYWPDGIYTAPTDEALKSDIVAAKDLGFNLLRKHGKVEPDRWYYWTDNLGILVWQDMPACFPLKKTGLNDAAKAQWLTEWKQILAQHMNNPSIVVWTTFNESWGQHDTAEIVELTKQIDPTRLVNDASGWNDMKVGDLHDTHAYPGPKCTEPEPDRAVVNGEFGGITMRVEGHMWTTNVVGYGKTLSDGWNVTNRYQTLLKAVYRLRDEQAMSAMVYTQLTDVEQESNGLLTYDRAIIKPNADFIRAANEGEFPHLPSSPTTAATTGSVTPKN